MECVKEKPEQKKKRNRNRFSSDFVEVKRNLEDANVLTVEDVDENLTKDATSSNSSPRIETTLELQPELSKSTCHLIEKEISNLGINKESNLSISNSSLKESYNVIDIAPLSAVLDRVQLPGIKYNNAKPDVPQIKESQNKNLHDLTMKQSNSEVSHKFDKVLQMNKCILESITKDHEISKLVTNYKAESMCIRPFTESQLTSLYINIELESVDQFVCDFIEAELKGTLKKHPLYELLDNYLLIRNKITGNTLEFEQLRKEYKESQDSLWSMETAVTRGRAECLDGNIVTATHTYNKAIFHRSVFQTICRILNSVRKIAAEYHILYSYSSEVLKLQIDAYLQTLINNCMKFVRMSQSPIALTTQLPPSELVPHINELRLCISILFSFQRRLVKDSIFVEETRKWLTRVVAILLRIANWQDHMFILNHVLRCSAGVGSWAANFIQAPLSEQNGDSPFNSIEINHIISVLSVILRPVEKREQFLEQFSQSEDVIGENLWILVDSDGEEDEDSVLPALRENDLVEIMSQLPLDNMFRKILNIRTKNGTDHYDNSLVSEHHILRFFAFGTKLIMILRRGLETYNQSRYNQFSKRLCRFMRHVVQFATDQWETFKINQHLDDSSMLQRLQVEYDAFFLRATHYLYSSQKLGAWQFLAVVPYHMVSIKTLWKIFYLLHSCDTKEDVILDPTDPTDFSQKLWEESLRLEFEEKLNKMIDAESYYLLNTFTNMALARREEDLDFIEAAVLDLLEVGFISEATRESCSKNARILLTYITSKYPHFMSNILDAINRNKNKIIYMFLYLYEELPLSIWQPSINDMELISTWVLHLPFSSDENRLARMIISRLNWDTNSNGHLFLPHKMHVDVALLIAQAVDKDEAWLQWAWKIILKLRLHYNDMGFTDLSSIPDIQNLDVVYKGIHQNKPFASLLALLISNWGHLVPLVCSKGLAQIHILLFNQQYYVTIFALFIIVPLFVECQEPLINSEHFQNVLVGLLNADRGYVNMAKSFIAPQYPILEQFGNMIQTHIADYRNYNLDNSKCLVRLWINSLVSVPGWNKDYGVLFLLDGIIKAAFFQTDALDVATSTLKELLQASTPQDHPGTISSIFKWASLSNAPQGSLLTSASIPNCPFLAYILINIEYEEREEVTGLWKEILIQLWMQKGKVNIDAAIKKATSNKKLPSFTSSSLCIYRWAQQALDTPVVHPLLPLLWQKFFSLYLVRIPVSSAQESVCVGTKFFQGVINFNYLKRIKKHLQEAVDYYKKEMDDISNDEEMKPKWFLYEQCFKIFKAYSLWLEEPRLQENVLHLPGLPPQYLPSYLALILQRDPAPWVEFVNFEEIRRTQEKSLQSWKTILYREKSKCNQPTPNSRSGMESEDPVERMLKRLNSFDLPKPPPEIVVSDVLVVQETNIENKEKMFKFLEPHFKIIQQFSHNYVLKMSEHIALDSSYKELAPQLYRSVLLKIKKKVNCSGSGSNKSCTGAALITLEMQEARINERLEHQIQSNRKEYESILHRYFQEPPEALCVASVVVQKIIETLQVQQQSNPQYSEMGVELFYYLVFLIGEETNAYIPARHFITTCLDKLGKAHIMGIDYETPRLLNKILEDTSLSGLLAPYFSPTNSSTANFLYMYSTVTENLNQKIDVLFGILSKFDISVWLTLKKPKISQRNEFIGLVLKALVKLGHEPQKEYQILHELFRKHLLCVFEFQFPEHYGDVLTHLLKASNPGVDLGCIAPSVWTDVLNSLAKPVQLKQTGPIREQLRQYAQRQHLLSYQDLLDTLRLLTKHFSDERLQYGLYGLYPKYRDYVDVFVLFLGMIGHALIVSAMNVHLGVLGDKLCEILWPHLRDAFAPWIAPYWMQNVKDNMPAWMQQLTDDRAILTPWIPADGPYAQKMTHMFFECLQFIIHTLPACNNILGFIWQWYVTNFAHSALKDHVLNVIHTSFLALPWNNYWPSTSEVELMLKVVDQYLPECHVFLGYIFIEMKWSDWLKVLVSNSPVQIAMRVHQCLLNLLVKLSYEPRIRGNHQEKLRALLIQAEDFDWNLIDAQILQQIMDWHVTSCNPMVLFCQDPLDIDFRVLHLIKTVSHYHQQLLQHSPDLLQKRHIYVRSYIKLLSVFVNRHKQLASSKQNSFKFMIKSQLNHFDLVVRNELETTVLLREYFGLLVMDGLSVIALSCFEEWISKKPSDSVVLKVVLEEVSSAVSDSQIVAVLYECCFDSYFNNSVNQLSVISWKAVSSYLKPFGPKQTELENILIQEGKILTLNALIYQKMCNNADYMSLLNSLLQWLIDIKITPYTEDKLPLIWLQILHLCLKYSHVDEINVSIILQKFSQTLMQISADKGISGWGKGLLGAIGLTKGDSTSLKFKFLCKALCAYILAQLPDAKGDFPLIRKHAGVPSVVGHPGGNKDCGKLLLNLEMGQSQGEIKSAAEMALKQIQDPNNSLHNANVFLMNLVLRLYTKPYLKSIENP